MEPNKDLEDLAKEFRKLDVPQKSLTGYIYHPDMLLHSLSNSDEKLAVQHPENPKRLSSIIFHLESVGLDKRCDIITQFEVADLEIIKKVHGERFVDYADEIWMEGTTRESLKYKDSYYNQHSSKAARLAVQGLLISVDKVLSNSWKNCFAAVRPPGHHAATNNRIAGFCFYNNVACAVRYAQEKYGIKRVLIYDWDVHHGDSTQRLFQNDKNILFVSLHRYDGGMFYPGRSGSLENIGTGEAEGYNLNLPWNPVSKELNYQVNNYFINKQIGDNEYIYAFERLARPIIDEFEPELIFISSGFDSCRGDPLGGIDCTQESKIKIKLAYCYILEQLESYANGKIIVALEGGYNFDSISRAAEGVLRVDLRLI